MAPTDDVGEPQDGLDRPRRLIAVAAISLGTVLAVIDAHIVTVALPTIAHDLHVTGSQSILIAQVYQLTLLMTMLPCSALGDRVGLKRMYQLGQIIFAIATGLCFFAENLMFLLVVRGLQAIGAAFSLSVMVAMIRTVYPSRMIGRGMGINALVVSATAAAAPAAGGLILTVAPWPWLFVTALPFALLSLLLGWKALPHVPPAAERYDATGAVLTVATFGLIFGGIEYAAHASTPIPPAGIVLLGIACGTWFVRHQRRKDQPILPIDLLGNPLIGLSVLGALLMAAGSTLLLLSLPFRLEHVHGFSPSEVGVILTPYPAMMIVASPLSGILSDRVHPGLLGAAGVGISVAGLLLLAFPPPQPGYIDFAWRLAICGAGSSFFWAPNARLIVHATPRHRTSAAGGLIQMMRLIGQISGASLLAMLLGLGQGFTTVPVLTAAVLSVMAGLCSLVRLRSLPAP